MGKMKTSLKQHKDNQMLPVGKMKKKMVEGGHKGTNRRTSGYKTRKFDANRNMSPQQTLSLRQRRTCNW